MKIMFQPLKNRVVVSRDKTETVTATGFAIPEAAQETKTVGVVLAVGKEVKDIAVGDKVLFGKHDGVVLDAEYFNQEGEVVLMSEDMIRGVISNV